MPPIIISQINLKNLMLLLPEGEFLRIHRSYVVSLNKVVRFTHQQITLAETNITLPIGRMYAKEAYKACLMKV